MAALLSPVHAPPPSVFAEESEGPEDESSFVQLAASTNNLLSRNPDRVLNLCCPNSSSGSLGYEFKASSHYLVMHSIEVLDSNETVDKDCGPRLMPEDSEDFDAHYPVKSVGVLVQHLGQERLDRTVAIVLGREDAMDFAAAEKNFKQSGVNPEKHWSRAFFEWLRSILVVTVNGVGQWCTLKMCAPSISKVCNSLVNGALDASSKRPAPESSPVQSSSSSSAASSAPAPPPSIPPVEAPPKKSRKSHAQDAPAQPAFEPLVVRAIDALREYHGESGQVSLEAFYEDAEFVGMLPIRRIYQCDQIRRTLVPDDAEKLYKSTISVQGGALGSGAIQIAPLRPILGSVFATLSQEVKDIIHRAFEVPAALASIPKDRAPTMAQLQAIMAAVAHLPDKYVARLM